MTVGVCPASQPYGDYVRTILHYIQAVTHESRSGKLPVVFTVKDPRSGHLLIGAIHAGNLPQLLLIGHDLQLAGHHGSDPTEIRTRGTVVYDYGLGKCMINMLEQAGQRLGQ